MSLLSAAVLFMQYDLHSSKLHYSIIHTEFTTCLVSVGDCYIVAGGILGLDPEGFAEVRCCFRCC